MGQVSKALGGGSQVEFQGKVYSLAPWNMKIQGLYEEYLERVAMSKAHKLAAALPPEAAADVLKGVAEDAAVGVFGFGGQKARQSLDSDRHLAHLVYLQIKFNHGEVMPELADELLAEKRAEVVAAINLGNADPNAAPPASETAAM